LKDLPSHLHLLAEAGADEAILVVDPITERSVRALEPVLRLLDGPTAGPPNSLPPG
jgi:hypothetical protein